MTRKYDSTITTYTGRIFDYSNPAETPVCLEDIAHALGMLCRFNGHIRRFYSVAQHSVLVSRLVEPGHALQALFHDAAEAYVGDMVSPLKRRIPNFGRLEGEIMRCVRVDLDLPFEDSICAEGIRSADRAALELEAYYLTNPRTPEHRLMEGGPPADVLEATAAEVFPGMPELALPPAAATILFLERERELRGALL